MNLKAPKYSQVKIHVEVAMLVPVGPPRPTMIQLRSRRTVKVDFHNHQEYRQSH